jgi:ribosomal protein L37AE/L43A
MHTRSEQRDILTSVRLKDGETKRMDCPFCGGKNTFTLTRKDGSRVWNCYKASCKAAGGSGDTRALTSIKNALKSPLKGSERVNPEPIPSTVSDPEHHPEVVQYLQQVHVYEAYESGLVRIAYDPKENRVLFYMNGGRGAVGRALDDRKPKWKAFGDIRGVFTCGNGPVAVVVEDAASASAVGCLPEYTGVALLGTHMDAVKKADLMAFDRVVLCLDNDASKKSIELLRKVQGLVPATVRFLRDDLKWLTKEQIKEVLQ